MRKEHKAILNLNKIDPLHEAELLSGKSYKEDDSTTWLGMAIQFEKSKQLELLLNSIGDTTFSNKLHRYLQIATKFGFEIIYEEDFMYDGRNEKQFILFHSELSILLNFDTFTWDHENEPNVNGGNFYYNWSPNVIERSGLTSSGHYYNEKDAVHLTLFEKDFSAPYYIDNYPPTPKWDNHLLHNEWRALCDTIHDIQNRLFEEAIKAGKRAVWVGDHDCREALITHIKALFENGIFIKQWKECAFPWLTNYGDHKDKNSMYPFNNLYDKTRRIISTFPINIQKTIGQYRP